MQSPQPELNICCQNMKMNVLREGMGGGGVHCGTLGGKGLQVIRFWLLCHTIPKCQGCSSLIGGDGITVRTMWENKNRICIIHMKYTGQLCYVADWSILVDTESFSCDPLPSWKKTCVWPCCSYHIQEDSFGGGDTHVIVSPYGH